MNVVILGHLVRKLEVAGNIHQIFFTVAQTLKGKLTYRLKN